MTWWLPSDARAPATTALLAAVAVLLWPTGVRRRVVRALFPAPRRRAPAGPADPGAPPAPPERAGNRGAPAGSRSVRAAWRRIRGRFASDRDEADDLVALLDALAPALEAGLDPRRAWTLAVASGGLETPAAGADLTAVVAAASDAGAPVGPALVDFARISGSGPLLLLGMAWALSEQTGAPLASTARTVARMGRAQRQAERRLEAVATESRTTARILLALPLSGPLFMAAIGLDPRRLGTAGPWVLAPMVAGVMLAVIGRWWLAKLADRVVRGPTIS